MKQPDNILKYSLNNDENYNEEINRIFSPEFRNRLDSIIPFNSLSNEIMKQVVDKFIIKLEAQLDEKNVILTLSEGAYDWLTRNGADEKYGARPLQRVIDEKIKKPLADELLFGGLKRGGEISIDVDNNADDLIIQINNKKILDKKNKTNKEKILFH